MRIAVVAHIRHPIAEPFMGGMEAHATMLCRGLRDRGHDVTLLAAGGSDDARLVPICDYPYEDILPWERWRGTALLDSFQNRAFGRAREIIADGQFDVVHNNALFPDLIGWLFDDGVPAVTSQHVPPFGRMREAVRQRAGDGTAQFTFASGSQLPLWFDRTPANARVAYNGVDCRLWRPGLDRSDRLVWTGRITPNKGLLEAIRAARHAGIALDIAGPAEDRGYLDACMSAASDADIRYHGQLSGEPLRRLVRQARAALVTPMWDEPFGLVAAEALASGVPVVAFDRGAMKEVVGSCGIVVAAGQADALAEAIGEIEEVDRTRCRERALAKFSIPAMIARYEKAYLAAIEASNRGAFVDASASSCSSTAALLA